MAQPVNKPTKFDAFVIALIIIISICSIAISDIYLYNGKADEVSIEVDGKPYASYKLESVSGEKQININTKFGHNTVVITKNSVYMKEASCKDKLDIKAGAIDKPNQMLVCLPNKVVVKLKGKNKIDAISY